MRCVIVMLGDVRRRNPVQKLRGERQMRLATLLRQTTAVAAIGLGAVLAGTPAAQAGFYVQTNLVSDIAGLGVITDPVLKNSWGVSESPTSPFWVSDQGTNVTTLYNVSGASTVAKVNINPPPIGNNNVAIPTTGAGPQGPTGQVNNSNTAAFHIGGANGPPARFIFANLNGTISAWAGGLTATIQATTQGAIYTGLAIDSVSNRLYAADGKQNRIDVFDSAFLPVSPPGGFVNPNLPAGLVPFNVQNIGGRIYVTYAAAGGRPAQIAAPEGSGAVAVFDTDGNFISQVVSGSKLASPWGIALAPSTFGDFANDLLVGNFSFVASEINAFDPTTGALEGTINVDPGAGNLPGGLWALSFGNGKAGGSPNILYFTDGINNERDGLFASLTVPEPSSMLLLAPVLGLVALRRARRQD
jgi:uncharacterized protein (TIGR03118 family)